MVGTQLEPTYRRHIRRIGQVYYVKRPYFNQNQLN